MRRYAPIRMRTKDGEQFDVLVVGAGLSGVGAACHLQRRCPDRSYVILEARERIGGTWDLFRYPGVRSDSDMHTLGYSFKPLEDAQAIADGSSILGYITDTAEHAGVLGKVRTGHRVVSAEWSGADGRWTVEAIRADTGEVVHMRCAWLMMCTGYYRYDGGYTPEFAGAERFSGPIVHPQQWPQDVHFKPDYDPWDQRLCIVPDGDLFSALSAGVASILTDQIETFTERGLRAGTQPPVARAPELRAGPAGLPPRAPGRWRDAVLPGCQDRHHRQRIDCSQCRLRGPPISGPTSELVTFLTASGRA